MGDQEFSGNIKSIQWNNRLKVLGLSVYFVFAVFVFATLYITAVMGVVSVFAGISEALDYVATHPLKILKIYLKIFAFLIGLILYFFYKDLKNIGWFFDCTALALPHTDRFYKTLEELCIMRGLPVPDLYIANDGGALHDDAVTGIVVMDLKGRASLMVTPAVYHLEQPELEAYLAQVVQRIYTKDTLFLTVFCFLGYFPYHLERHSNAIFRTIAKPLLIPIDLMMAPVRKAVLNMSFSRLDVGALELTKRKAPMRTLVSKLTPLSVMNESYHTPFLALFLAKSPDEYRQEMLDKA